ncbi:hypothetical protein B2G71_11000 [Novosphingobium sp. PC22D]|uniref:hypothetical protein n=1 Tax=Novosphingobium sp. PC22D TaxID=1962403 RepID=UPI000BF19C05|nr:hypothetical protein [Novosphingobium sp. PC22D]PEQ12809.1 hypothetical protein B2G71_11000 [Novosphingobium sp. PC22D]
MVSRSLAIVAPALILTGCAASARLSELETLLAAQDSATAALEQWCARRGLADPPTIRAVPAAPDAAPPAPPGDARALLEADAHEALAYRHVELTCGETVLSVAHNWYVPARLTGPMNAALAESEASFGKVAAPLAYRRERLDSIEGAGPGCPAGTVLTHRALLRLPDSRPLALLVECYTEANLRPDPAG